MQELVGCMSMPRTLITGRLVLPPHIPVLLFESVELLLETKIIKHKATSR